MIEYNNYDKAIIVSGDGDFHCLVEYLEEKEKLLKNVKAKEKALKIRERNLVEGFEKEKEKIIKIEQQKIKAQRQKIELTFKNKLASATEKAVKQEKEKLQNKISEMKLNIKIEIQKKMKSANEKLLKQKEAIEMKAKSQKHKNKVLLQQYQTFQAKSEIQLLNAKAKIKSLEEQQNKNETPQVLGLLEETVFLEKMKERYGEDTFDHPGKSGDVIQHIIYNKKKWEKLFSN